MSLLMDALRKAEQQKQRLAAQGQPERDLSGGLELEPLSAQKMPAGQEGQEPHGEAAFPAHSPADTDPEKPAQPQPADGFDGSAKISGGPLPDLPSRLGDLDEQFIAHAAEARATALAARKTSPPPPKPVPESHPQDALSMVAVAPAVRPSTTPTEPPRASAEESARAAARNLFAAKQPAEKSRRSFAIAVGLATVIAIIGIGIYFWWQLQPKSGLLTSGAPKPPPPIPATAATTLAAAQPPASSAVPPAPTFPAPAALSSHGAGQTSLQPLPRADGDEDDAIDAVPPPPKAKQPPAARLDRPAATAPPTAQAPINVTAKPQKIDPLLQQAYDAFNNGELALAQSAWMKLLQTDPKNTDALHGLAAIAQQRRQADQAADYYLRALEADPKDALALSGLIALRGHADPQQTESRLKTLLAEQPDSPFLNFALGNLYARTARWADAQQAYFKAHAADASNPDYLFNLAVSLDQLRQPRLAAQYYNQALGATAQRPVGFDPAQVAARLKILQPELQPELKP